MADCKTPTEDLTGLSRREERINLEATMDPLKSGAIFKVKNVGILRQRPSIPSSSSSSSSGSSGKESGSGDRKVGFSSDATSLRGVDDASGRSDGSSPRKEGGVLLSSKESESETESLIRERFDDIYRATPVPKAVMKGGSPSVNGMVMPKAGAYAMPIPVPMPMGGPGPMDGYHHRQGMIRMSPGYLHPRNGQRPPMPYGGPIDGPVPRPVGSPRYVAPSPGDGGGRVFPVPQVPQRVSSNQGVGMTTQQHSPYDYSNNRSPGGDVDYHQSSDTSPDGGTVSSPSSGSKRRGSGGRGRGVTGDSLMFLDQLPKSPTKAPTASSSSAGKAFSSSSSAGKAFSSSSSSPGGKSNSGSKDNKKRGRENSVSAVKEKTAASAATKKSRYVPTGRPRGRPPKNSKAPPAVNKSREMSMEEEEEEAVDENIDETQGEREGEKDGGGEKQVRKSSSGRTVTDPVTSVDLPKEDSPALPAAVGGRNMKFLSLSQTKDFNSATLASERAEFIPTEEKKKKRGRPKKAGDDAKKKINFNRANALVDGDWQAIEIVALYAAHKEVDAKASDFWGKVATAMKARGCDRSRKDCAEKWNKGLSEAKSRIKKTVQAVKAGEKSPSPSGGEGAPVRSSPRLQYP